MTPEEKRSLSYFHFEKGDMTRWVKWDDIYGELETNHPEILEAYKKYIMASKYLDYVVKTECEVNAD
jgi:hypothetical protein